MSEHRRPIDEELVAEMAERIAASGDELRRRISARASRDVQVVAVTKGHPTEAALGAVQAGFDVLGENYAQELRDKAPVVAGATWHFIGGLQTNKVRMLAPHVSLWETLDRPSVIREVAKRVPGAAVLVQVDLAGIQGRGGCGRSEAPGVVEAAVTAGLDVRGLMGVGPPGAPEDAREGFRWLRATADAMELPEVSMGMSADLDVALDEGATMVRVGTALIGERPPR